MSDNKKPENYVSAFSYATLGFGLGASLTMPRKAEAVYFWGPFMIGIQNGLWKVTTAELMKVVTNSTTELFDTTGDQEVAAEGIAGDAINNTRIDIVNKRVFNDAEDPAKSCDIKVMGIQLQSSEQTKAAASAYQDIKTGHQIINMRSSGKVINQEMAQRVNGNSDLNASLLLKPVGFTDAESVSAKQFKERVLGNNKFLTMPTLSSQNEELLVARKLTFAARSSVGALGVNSPLGDRVKGNNGISKIDALNGLVDLMYESQSFREENEQKISEIPVLKNVLKSIAIQNKLLSEAYFQQQEEMLIAATTAIQMLEKQASTSR